MLTHGANARRAAPGTAHVADRFARQAAAHPRRIAIRSADRAVTYAELNGDAAAIAARLRALNVGPETIVAVHAERSIEAVAGILGIMKAGGVFLPIDPANPEEHTRFVLADSRASVIVADERSMPSLRGYDVPCVCLGQPSDATTWAQHGTREIWPDTAAYVIYTSGSTGRPKGVVVTHRNLETYLEWVERVLFEDGALGVPFLTDLTFDACLKQLFAPLVAGREVHLLSKRLLSDPAALVAALRDGSTTGLNCVPSLWAYLLDAFCEGRAPVPERLEALYVGGEALRPELVARTLARLPHLRIWNLYGPTESTANATAARIGRDDTVTIGHPVTGTEAHILDETGQLVANGVAGELFLSGAGLARGYLHRPALTAERFVPNPFSTQPGSRMYRTGDSARRLEDGRIEFLGRVDDQVKIRGHRIELGEIEAALATYEPIRHAVVVAREHASGGLRLIAYVVAAKGEAIDVRALRGHLMQRLPEYMLPAAYVCLDALPLTRHGKIDRRALPPLDSALAPASAPASGPDDGRTPTERAVAAMWMSLLGLESVNDDDSFFAIGGHSLLVIKLAARIRQDLGISLPLRVIFDAPTIRDQAAAVERARSAASLARTPPPREDATDARGHTVLNG
jgi:amino acid adenylation domain-containing protein